MAQPTVVVTGATGYIASLVLPGLRAGYQLRLLDTTQQTGDGDVLSDVHIVDLTDPDLDAYRHHFRNADAVVHLAYINPRTNGPYEQQRTNIDMTYHVYQLALEEGVKRVVVASSNHAADWYELLILDKKHDMVAPDDKPLSYNFYGWAKDACEHLGFVYASGHLGRQLEVVPIRIGAPREVEGERYQGNPRAFKRHLAAYVSARDLQQLFVKSIEVDAESLRRADGVPFQIFYGISDNTRHYWSLDNARKILGYEPQDDSEVRFADAIRRYLIEPEGAEHPGRV